ncbi:MAG: Wzz/FepE/Etk N-terminal domain-containing protein, partial [Acidobacteria bacterium]|nr:Wzz/FepE/Etk N-terminal domain-containing protein [Acidobacteriota bacterium]
MDENGHSGITVERGLRELLQVLRRRKWLIVSTFVVTAIALAVAFAMRVRSEAVCLVAVKKPSQMFVSTRESALSNASVPLLEGNTYKDMIEGVAFSVQVAERLAREGLRLSGSEVGQRLGAEFREPDLLRVRARDREPSTAIRIANVACESLADLNLQELQVELEASLRAIKRHLSEAGRELEAIQAALAAYMQREGLINLETDSGSSEISRALGVLAEHEMARAKEETALQAAQKRLKELRNRPKTPAAVLAFPVMDPAVAALRAQVEGARVKLWDAQKQ